MLKGTMMHDMRGWSYSRVAELSGRSRCGWCYMSSADCPPDVFSSETEWYIWKWKNTIFMKFNRISSVSNLWLLTQTFQTTVHSSHVVMSFQDKLWSLLNIMFCDWSKSTSLVTSFRSMFYFSQHTTKCLHTNIISSIITSVFVI